MDKKNSRFFPFLSYNKNLIYLDSAGTTLKPKKVIQAINKYYQNYSINNHSGGGSSLFNKVQKTIQATRKIIAQTINSQSEEIIFFPSTTYSLNILALSLDNRLKEGDKICLTYLEHSSNLYPWEAIIQRKKLQLSFLPLDRSFTIDIEKLDEIIDKKTKIVSFFHTSNSLGSTNSVSKIAKKIKELSPNCLIIIDACQSVAHSPIDVKEWNIDALVFSGHKVYGPTGIGVLWIKKELAEKMPHILWGGGKKASPSEKIDNNLPLSQKFEVGTLPLAQIFGLKASFEFLNNLEIEAINKNEKELKDHFLKIVRKLKEVIIYNQGSETTNIILFNLKDFHPHDVSEYLQKNNIYVRAGNFCCPYLDKAIKKESAIRISLAIYNTKKDINKLVKCLENLIKNPNLIVDIF
ncbi:MAG: aminotransferase class V-fold PLP-dependent enzyme [Spiroplasmataceae bacterium]|nr:aminotransferase class V-fold PLP-dependent enzyme [Spiroplasmataceae bacterium]